MNDEDFPDQNRFGVLNVGHYVICELLATQPGVSCVAERSTQDKTTEGTFPTEHPPLFETKRYYYLCRPQVIHCHYESGEMKSIQNLERESVECYYPKNIIYYKECGDYSKDVLSCFNPSKVLIDEKEITPTPQSVVFDNLEDSKVVYFNLMENDKLSNILNAFHIGHVAEIYLNHLDKFFIDKMVEHEKEKGFPFVHIKYASVQRDIELKLFRDINGESPRLKFTPFTTSDCRILNRQVANQLKEDQQQLINHFTDFGQHGHYFVGFPVRCFVRYREVGKNGWSTFWERSRNNFQLDLERDDVPDYDNDEVLRQPNHAEIYLLRRMKEFIKNHNSNYEIESESRSSDENDDQAKTATSINLDKVKIESGGKTKKVKYASPIILANGNKRSSKTLNNQTQRIYNDLKNVSARKLEVEIFINASPCKDCFEKLKTFVEVDKDNYYDVFIHVKYANFYKESNAEDIKKTNGKGISNLKVTPFTVDDWRTLNRALIDRIESEMEIDDVTSEIF